MRKTVIIAMLLLLAMGTALPEGHALGKKELLNETIAVDFAREVLKGGYGTVKTEELAEWIEQGRPILLVDTMPYADSYRMAHVPGAVNFEFPTSELQELDPETMTAFRNLLGPDKDQMIVVYCAFTHCGRSHNGAMWAVRLGYRNVFRYPGGITAWKEGKNPVEKVK